MSWRRRGSSPPRIAGPLERVWPSARASRTGFGGISTPRPPGFEGPRRRRPRSSALRGRGIRPISAWARRPLAPPLVARGRARRTRRGAAPSAIRGVGTRLDSPHYAGPPRPTWTINEMTAVWLLRVTPRTRRLRGTARSRGKGQRALPAPPRVAPAPPTEHQHHEQHDQDGFHGLPPSEAFTPSPTPRLARGPRLSWPATPPRFSLPWCPLLLVC